MFQMILLDGTSWKTTNLDEKALLDTFKTGSFVRVSLGW